MNGQPNQSKKQTVIEKLVKTLQNLHVSDEEKEKAGVYLDKDSSQYGERGRFSKEEEN